MDTDRRRLRRDIRWEHPGDGVYATSDSMRAVRRAGSRKWVEGVRQPYHTGDEWQFDGPAHRRLADAQAMTEAAEAIDPRADRHVTPFNDRRGA